MCLGGPVCGRQMEKATGALKAQFDRILYEVGFCLALFFLHVFALLEQMPLLFGASWQNCTLQQNWKVCKAEQEGSKRFSKKGGVLVPSSCCSSLSGSRLPFRSPRWPLLGRQDCSLLSICLQTRLTLMSFSCSHCCFLSLPFMASESKCREDACHGRAKKMVDKQVSLSMLLNTQVMET